MADAAGKVFPVHSNKFEFDANGLESTDEQIVTPADPENFAPPADGTMEEWFIMNAVGQAKTAVIDKKLSFGFKGRQSIGNPGSDYIAGLTWKSEQGVMAKFEWTIVSGAALACDVIINVITPGGRDTTNIDGLGFEVASYGKPTFTPATPAV